MLAGVFRNVSEASVSPSLTPKSPASPQQRHQLCASVCAQTLNTPDRTPSEPAALPEWRVLSWFLTWSTVRNTRGLGGDGRDADSAGEGGRDVNYAGCSAAQ